eukprot:RCo045816
MSATDEALRANVQYAKAFTPALAALPMPPGKKLAIVACMDARLHPEKLLGLREGDAHCIRNAGGRFADALRSLVISQTLLGTEEVVFIHHTDCGMLTFTDESIRTKLSQERGLDASHIAFLHFSNVAQSVLNDIRAYKKSDLVRQDIPVRGFIYDVKTGSLQEVKDS